MTKDRFQHLGLGIPVKARRILLLVLVAMVLISLRMWHLAVIQYDDRAEAARRPRQRTILEPAKRGTIRDRFNIPMAINKIQYNAGILYSELRQVPQILWERGPDGQREKHFKRKGYIAELAAILGHELGMDSERVEDLIHAKAALYYNIPFVLKEDISEEQYYRLRMLQKDWVGIHVQPVPKRDYPKGKVGAELIGYMGAISRSEYDQIMQEIKELEAYIQARDEGDTPELPKTVASPIEARQRLKDLKRRAYRANDYVGKGGIEGKYEESLRGFHGRKQYESDARGNFLRELPGAQEPLSGQRVLLSISSELQEFAEELLIQNEQVRQAQIGTLTQEDQKAIGITEPWIRGGAIIAMEPNTGEVLALASYPRFDPNDFIRGGDPQTNAKKQQNILKWFEHEAYLADLWDHKRTFDREIFNDRKGRVEEEKVLLHWNTYLNLILPKNNKVRESLSLHNSILEGVTLQGYIDKLLELSGQNNLYAVLNKLYPYDAPYNERIPAVLRDTLEEHFEINYDEILSIKEGLQKYFLGLNSNYDKVLFVDLMRLAIRGDLFSHDLLEEVQTQSITSYRDTSAAFTNTEEAVKKMAQILYHDLQFKTWRQEYMKDFLRQKREEEKAAKTYARPYIDLLDKQENAMFDDFWQENRWEMLLVFLTGTTSGYPQEELDPYIDHFICWWKELSEGAHQGVSWRKAYDRLQQAVGDLPIGLAQEYLQTFRSFNQLTRPLYGKYPQAAQRSSEQLEKHLAMAFYPVYGFGYARSQAFRQATQQGSIFKLVTAYTALKQNLENLGDKKLTLDTINPLTIYDQYQILKNERYVGKFIDGTLIPQLYKGGYIPRSLSRNIGKTDLLRAITTSSNVYFSILAGEYLEDPYALSEMAKSFSYGSRTGIDLPYEIAGRVPNDLDFNKTGVYTTAIGQHTLVVTPLQTTTMLSTIANGGNVFRPKIVNILAGREPKKSHELLRRSRHFAFQEDLATVGIDFPLFTEAEAREKRNQITFLPSETVRQIFMPDVIREVLVEGMRRVTSRALGPGLSSLMRLYEEQPEAIGDFISLGEELVGKTSTAETVEHINLDGTHGTNKVNHVWFGGIAFDTLKEGGEYLFYTPQGAPELVVVVYLKYGSYGKDAMPLAAQMVQKWRQIKARHQN